GWKRDAVHRDAGEDGVGIYLYRAGGAGGFPGWAGGAVIQGDESDGKGTGFAGRCGQLWGGAGDDPLSIIAVELGGASEWAGCVGRVASAGVADPLCGGVSA